MKKTLLLIDGDQLLYQITSACEVELPAYDVLSKDVAWAYPGWFVLGSDYDACKRTVLDKIDRLVRSFDRYIITFSTNPNFRHSVLPSYKGGRVKTRKPLGYYMMMNYLIISRSDNCRRIDGLEADDVMSIIGTDPKYTSKFEITIWSQDKDMKQVPDVWRDDTTGAVKFQTLSEANHFRWGQCLTGDSTDGYRGCPSFGPKLTERYLGELLNSLEERYLDEVLSAYIGKDISVDDALAQINCALILRHSEYNFKTNQPILVTQ